MQSARRIEQQHVIGLQFRGLHRAFGDINRLLPRHNRQCRHVDLRTEHRQLLLRRRTIDVERGHQNFLAIFLGELFSNLGSRRRFTRALETNHHDDRGWRYIKIELNSV